MGFDGFQNPPVGAQGIIARPVFKSDNYVPGTSGWAIFRNGNAEFNALGGSFQITGQGIFFYVPTAGIGNLFASFANVGGTDPYGNGFNAGFFINQHQNWLTGDGSDTVLINPTGALGPEILFAESGFNFATHFIQFANELRAEAVNASGALFRINMPALVTGGVQGSASSPALQPPFNVDNTMTAYASNAWAPLSIKCPASESIALNIKTVGFNASTTGSTLTTGVEVKAGVTQLLAPLQYRNAATISPEGAAAGSTNMHQKYVRYTVGQDILSGRAGQTLTLTPFWQISSHTGTVSIDNLASISVEPLMFSQANSG